MTQYSDGRGGLHNTEEGARQAQRDADAPMNEMGKLGGAVIGFIIAVLTFLPAILSMVLSALLKLMFKLGIIGRVIQSALVGTVIGFLGVIVADSAGVDVSDDLIGLLVAVPCFTLPALWYYYSHYFSLKARIKGDDIVGSFTLTIAILLWGPIIILIIQLVLSALGFFDFIRGYDSSKFPKILYALPFVVAIGYYIKTTVLGFREETAAIREEEKSPIIGAVLSAVFPFALLFVLSSLPSSTQSTTEEKAIYEQEQAGVVAAKPAWTKKQEKIAAKCPAKSVLIIDAGGNYGTRPLYKEANKNSTPITELKHEEVLTSTGEMLFFSEAAGYIPVDYKDDKGKVTKGWIKTSTGGKYDSHNVEVLIGKTDGKATLCTVIPKDSYEAEFDRSFEKNRRKIGGGKDVTLTGEGAFDMKGRVMYARAIYGSDTGWVAINYLKKERM